MTIGCANPKTIDGITYDTYGLANKDQVMNPDIEYKIVFGNVVWSIILSETIIVPVYMVGWSMWEPVGKKDLNAVKGQIGYKH